MLGCGRGIEGMSRLWLEARVCVRSVVYILLLSHGRVRSKDLKTIHHFYRGRRKVGAALGKLSKLVMNRKFFIRNSVKTIRNLRIASA